MLSWCMRLREETWGLEVLLSLIGRHVCSCPFAPQHMTLSIESLLPVRGQKKDGEGDFVVQQKCLTIDSES